MSITAQFLEHFWLRAVPGQDAYECVKCKAIITSVFVFHAYRIGTSPHSCVAAEPWRDISIKYEQLDRDQRAEFRKSLGLIHGSASPMTDDQLRAECERRGIEFARERGNEARRYESASARCVELEKDRDSWKQRAEAWDAAWAYEKKHHEARAEKAEAELKAVLEQLHQKSVSTIWPQPTVGAVVTALRAKLASGDMDGACDVIDEQVFQERLSEVEGLRGGRKLAADIRGVIVEKRRQCKACNRSLCPDEPIFCTSCVRGEVTPSAVEAIRAKRPDTSLDVDPLDLLCAEE